MGIEFCVLFGKQLSNSRQQFFRLPASKLRTKAQMSDDGTGEAFFHNEVDGTHPREYEEANQENAARACIPVGGANVKWDGPGDLFVAQFKPKPEG